MSPLPSRRTIPFWVCAISVFVFGNGAVAAAPEVIIDFGTASFQIDPVNSIGNHVQVEEGIDFGPGIALGDTLGGIPSTSRPIPDGTTAIGLLMQATGTNPGLPFSLETFDANLVVMSKFFGTTVDVGNTPTFVPLTIVQGSLGTAEIAGLQITWDGVAPGASLRILALAVHSAPTTPTPAPSPMPTVVPTPETSLTPPPPPSVAASVATMTSPAKTRRTNYTFRLVSSEEVAQVRYRLKPPGTRKFGKWTSRGMKRGESDDWSAKLKLPKRGRWQIQVRTFDASGNPGDIRTMVVRRR